MVKCSIIIFLLIGVLSFNSQAQSNYEVISTGKDNRGVVNTLSIYVHSIKDVKKVNPALWAKYKKSSTASFQIFYFDNKQIAQKYYRLLFDNKISDAQIEKISKHVVAKFQYVLGKENLYVGEDALLY
jgi:hypothetical protein